MALDPYTGVRDFYPEDERVQKYIFDAMRRAVEAYGYEEMNASILEPTDLYTAKTSEEIVSKQTYTFTDRGDRSVTLRPEMTPTVARMVAAKKNMLPFPLRWYSIQNFFRYENTQRGRLREFWQLNADIFGVAGPEADAEIIKLAYQVMTELKAADTDFEIKYNNRNFLTRFLKETLELPTEKYKKILQILDAAGKKSDWKEEAEESIGLEKWKKLLEALSQESLLETLLTSEERKYWYKIRDYLKDAGIKATWDRQLTRGFDYYTGMVFEVFDTNIENKRSMFGGGRYDNLVGQYGKESVPAVGFAMGDVVTRNFLETHTLLGKLRPSTKLYLIPKSVEDIERTEKFANMLRKKKVNIAVGMKHTDRGEHIRTALKLKIPYFIEYSREMETEGMVVYKNLTKETVDMGKKIEISKLAAALKKN